MTARILFPGLPQPPEGEQWCAVCAGLYKFALITHPPIAAAIDEALNSEEDETVVVSRPREKELLLPGLSVAVTTGVAMLLHNALVPVCWEHMSAVTTETASQPAQQTPPPGMRLPGFTRMPDGGPRGMG
jgi:hypothetical protein